MTEQIGKWTEHDVAKLAVAQSMYKLTAGMVSTKDPDNLRARADVHFQELYEQTGAKSFDLNVAGQKLGTYSLRTSREQRKQCVSVLDSAAYLAWCVDNGLIKVDEKAVLQHFEDTGEMPGGAEIVEMVTPERISGGTLKVDVGKVERAFGKESMVGALMGEVE